MIPDIIFRQKAMINTKIGNYRYIDFPTIESIEFSSPTYNRLHFLEENLLGISMFHDVLQDITNAQKYTSKTGEMRQRIDNQLFYLNLYEYRADRGISLRGAQDVITNPLFYLHGHAVLTKSYRRAVMAGAGVISTPVQGDIKIEIKLGTQTTEKFIVETYGFTDMVQSAQADRSLKISDDFVGTSIKQSVARAEAIARSRENVHESISNI